MVDTAFTYQFNSTKRLQYLSGVASIYLSWLVVPFILLFGYYIQVLVSISTGKKELPPIDNPIRLGKTGFIGLFIAFSYSGFLCAAPMLSAVYVGSNFIVTPSTTTPQIVNSFLLIVFLFVVLYILVLPLVLCWYGRTGNIRDAYDVEKLVSIAATEEFAKAILSTITLTTFLIGITGILTIVTKGFAFLLIPFALFWYILATAFFYGRAVQTITTPETNPTTSN